MPAEAMPATELPHHVYPLRVYFEDTDAGGIVYYANYLKFAERARTEMMREAGAEHSGLMREERVMITVRRCEADFLAPARLDDVLEVHTGIDELRGASLWVEQVVRRGADEIARMRIRLACVGADGRPAKLPERLRAALDPISRKGSDKGSDRKKRG
jgi:acyl-CoA thioester hydrolase